MKQIKYLFAIAVISMATRMFNLRMFFIGTMVWDVIVSCLILLLCLYILFVQPRCFFHKALILCTCIFVASLIVDTFACSRLHCPYFTVIKAMKFIVPGPMLCFVLYKFYNKTNDLEIVCNALKYTMFFYLLLQFYAYFTHSYTSVFYDEFSSLRYDLSRQRNFAPCVECFMIIVFILYLVDIQPKKTTLYMIEKWLYIISYSFFILFVFMSKIYLITTLIVLCVWILFCSSFGFVRLIFIVTSFVLCVYAIDSVVRDEEDSTFKLYYEDFKYDNNHSSWARKESLSGYYELFKETKGMGLGHAAIHYDRDFAYLALDRRITIYDIGAIGVFYQYGISMIVVSVIILSYFINTLLKARYITEPTIKKLSICMTLFLVSIVVSLTPLWLHEIRACVCGFVFYFFMLIEDQILIDSSNSDSRRYLRFSKIKS